jgi:hypothetical protein
MKAMLLRGSVILSHLQEPAFFAIAYNFDVKAWEWLQCNPFLINLWANGFPYNKLKFSLNEGYEELCE